MEREERGGGHTWPFLTSSYLMCTLLMYTCKLSIIFVTNLVVNESFFSSPPSEKSSVNFARKERRERDGKKR